MICTVQPASPDTLTRTRRNPSSASTGVAIEATRAATPVSAITRGSPSVPVSVPAPVPVLVVSVAGSVLAAMVADVIKASGCRCLDLSCPAKSCAPQSLACRR